MDQLVFIKIGFFMNKIYQNFAKTHFLIKTFCHFQHLFSSSYLQ